jgi:hypothetical protein
MEEGDRVITISLREPRKKRTKKVQAKYQQPEGPTTQDRLSANPLLMQDKLRHFEKIEPTQYVDVQPGTFIRYLVHKEIRSPDGKERVNTKIRMGGYILVNSFPDYWVLQAKGNSKKSVTWSVPLKARSGNLPNEYFRRKGLLIKTDKMRYAEAAFDSIIRKEVKLVDPKELTRLRRIAGEIDSDDDEPPPKTRAVVFYKEDEAPHYLPPSHSSNESPPLQRRGNRLVTFTE